MSHHGQCLTVAAVTAGAIGGAYCAFQIYQNYYQKTKLPTEWTQVGTLSDLYIYPIKSCGPVVADRAECSMLGLRDGWLRDRVLMVVDKNMNFVTARAHPELLLVQPSVKGSVLTLQHSDMEPLHLNLAEVIIRTKPKTAVVWGTQVPVYDCGYEPAEWFSRIMDKSSDNYRLVYYASQKSRSLREATSFYSFYKFRKNDTGALPDEVSFNLINDASVDDLNKRLVDCKVSHRNFRPNFVLKGAQPYDEDKWKFVKIGDHVYEIIKPCGRCILTTIDPETGVRNAKTEPLETLKSYRQVSDPEERKAAGSSPRMGLQMALRSEPGGMVSLNDPIYVA
ncbi:mitochondrial amidoxime-reducing component 1 isoform X2 [Pectinophora gossypiella]|uniref:mitochondrial amidoxime-reducing component 1 isoform X2 n=1 Tax=Pectinophora gossypiella TaxID=13191 RepID=UPI00214E6567|nr:mitochondrial amidoxime-reducing component 1 isoform X2 [Pectinophora gossypiella]